MTDLQTILFEFFLHRPLLMLIVMALPLWIVARRWGLFPAKRLLYFTAIPAVCSVMMIQDPFHGNEIGGWRFSESVLAVLLIVDGIVLALAVVDMALVIPANKFSCTRKMIRVASQGKRHEVELELVNRSRRGCAIEILDDLPQSFVAEPEQFDTTIKGHSKTQFIYDFVCNHRGKSVIECVHLKIRSPLGLWRGYYRVPFESVVNVYPDMKQITEYDLLARTNRLSLLGLRRSRKIGQDNEFERLRDYTQDDNFKHIDWRSTARRRKLIVRDFQANQSQRIIFMVDCGRMMTGKSDGISLLDHSINAMLMLSYVALRQGDSVGMISFSDRIHQYTPARNGVKHINRLLHASYDQHATHVESRYDEAFLYLRTHCLKRSLVILVSNVIDEINAHQIKQYMGSLTGRHLPLGVLLRDRSMFNAVDEYESSSNPSPSSIYQAAAASDVLSWRHQVIQDLRHQGVMALDLFPDQLTSQLVNQYLEIKARHLL